MIDLHGNLEVDRAVDRGRSAPQTDPGDGPEEEESVHQSGERSGPWANRSISNRCKIQPM